MEQPAVKLAVICSGMGDRDVNTFSQSAPTDKACYVYRLLNATDVIVVMCNTAVSPEQSFSWTNEVSRCHVLQSVISSKFRKHAFIIEI